MKISGELGKSHLEKLFKRKKISSILPRLLLLSAAAVNKPATQSHLILLLPKTQIYKKFIINAKHYVKEV